MSDHSAIVLTAPFWVGGRKSHQRFSEVPAIPGSMIKK